MVRGSVVCYVDSQNSCHRKLFVKKSKGNNNERTTVGDPQSLSSAPIYILFFSFSSIPLKEEIFRRDPTCHACSSWAAEFFLVTSRMDSFSKSKALLALMTVKRRCEKRISNTMDQYANYPSERKKMTGHGTHSHKNQQGTVYSIIFSLVFVSCWIVGLYQLVVVG